MSSQSQTDRDGRTLGGETPLFTDPEEVLVSMQEIIGRKWHPIILYYLLAEGPMGFSALKDRVSGISSKMLSESLDDLEAAGLVTRELLNDKPVRVEYSLTDRGESLEGLVTEMVRWGAEYGPEFDDADPTEEVAATTGPGRSTVPAWEG